jgi:hypothetical protein
VGYFGAHDVDAEVARLVAHGAKVLEAPTDVVRPQHTWVVVELVDEPGGTRVVLTHTGWQVSALRDEPQWEQPSRTSSARGRRCSTTSCRSRRPA